MSISDSVDSITRDIWLTIRGLSRRPAFTFAAVLTLALGIGATTAIFSVVYSVLINPLPYPNSDELVRIRHSAPGLNTADFAASSNMVVTYGEENHRSSLFALTEKRESGRDESILGGGCGFKSGRGQTFFFLLLLCVLLFLFVFVFLPSV